MTNKRKLIKTADIVIVLILITTAFILFFSLYKSSSNDVYAEISYDGKTSITIKLETSEDKKINMQDNQNVSFEIKDHKIRFIDVNCPDKICESVGYINKANETAICMPNKVSLRIISKSKKFDAIT